MTRDSPSIMSHLPRWLLSAQTSPLTPQEQPTYLELALPAMSHHIALTGRASFWLTEFRGKGNKLGEGEGSKLGEPCPKVRFSQNRLAIKQAYFAQMSFTQMLLRANLTQPLNLSPKLPTPSVNCPIFC